MDGRSRLSFMRKIIDYTIIAHTSERKKNKEGGYSWGWIHRDVEKEVKEMIANGWEPLGSPIYTYQDGCSFPLVMTQAMVKYEEIKEY